MAGGFCSETDAWGVHCAEPKDHKGLHKDVMGVSFIPYRRVSARNEREARERSIAREQRRRRNYGRLL